MADIFELCKVFAIWGKTIMIKIMIVGQKWLAEQLLKQCLLNSNIKVVAVSPPNKNDRLALLANQNNIAIVLHYKQLTANQIPNDTDLILTAHAYCFVTAKARNKARYGAVGYHPSLLPKYKGKNAIVDCLENRELVTGGSLYQLDDGWDTGQILLQQSVMIDSDDTALSLWSDKLAPLGLELFADYLRALINGGAK